MNHSSAKRMIRAAATDGERSMGAPSTTLSLGFGSRPGAAVTKGRLPPVVGPNDDLAQRQQFQSIETAPQHQPGRVDQIRPANREGRGAIDRIQPERTDSRARRQAVQRIEEKPSSRLFNGHTRRGGFTVAFRRFVEKLR